MSKADRRARKRENKQTGRAEREAAVKRAKQRSGLIRGSIAVAAIIGGIALILTLGGGGSKKKAAPTTVNPAATTSTVAATTTTSKLPVGCDNKVPTPGKPQTYSSAPKMTIDRAKTYTATMTTTCGTIKLQLDAKNAPIATNNFVFLAQKHFYDGLKWHRVVKGFVIQGGDPKGDGSGGPGYTVKGETPSDGYPLGSIAAAKGTNDPPGSMGSQFFIVTGQNGTTLPHDYARWGKVTAGFDVAQKMESLSNGDGPPTHPLYIFKVTISES
jgi:cyclophilin family peptidyl-prolyl cis-trans isomerase